MDAYGWKSQIIRAAADPDGAVMASLVLHLAACHRANEFLHSKGYGLPGQAIDAAMSEVPEAHGH